MVEKSEAPQFPIKFINFTCEEEQLYHNIEELVVYHQEWDTEDPQYAEEGLFIDSVNRRVRLMVEGMDVKRFELYDAEPVPSDQLIQLIQSSRALWKQRRKQGGLKGMVEWLLGLFRKRD